MAAQRKARGDAKLKTLSEEKQQRIVEWLDAGTQAEAKAKIKAVFDIDTSAAALSEFYSWRHVGRELEEAANFTDEIKQHLLNSGHIDLDEEHLNQVMQSVFEYRAAKAKDSDLFLELRKMRLAERSARTKAAFKERELELKARQIELLEKKAARADEAETVTKSTLTPAEKEARYKEIFGLG